MGKRKKQVITEEEPLKLPDNIENIDIDNPEVKEIIVAMSRSMSFSGPLPPADHFKIYVETYPDAAKKILKYMVDEQKSRHAMEGKLLDHKVSETRRGQEFAFILMLGLIAGAIYCVHQGLEIGAGIFLSGVGLSIIGKFIK